MNSQRLSYCVALLYCLAISGLAAAEAEQDERTATESSRSPSTLVIFDAPHNIELPAPPPDRSPSSPLDSMEGLPVRADVLADEAPLSTDFEQLRQRLRSDAAQYRQSLQAMEANGAWYQGLTQELMGFGSTLQQLGQHRQAIEVFDRASHLARVNLGLDTLEQVQALDQRINSHLALDEWREADEQHQYRFYLHNRVTERNDPALIPALETLANWNLSLYFRGFGDAPLERLLDAYSMYNAAHGLSLMYEEPDPGQQLKYLDAMAGAAYLVARSNISFEASSYQAGTRAFDETSVVDASRVSTSLYSTNGYAQGESALEQIVETLSRMPGDEEALRLRRAEALARLGDWYLLFERRQAARSHYEQAWRLLYENDPERARTIFDKVQVLPQFATFKEQRRFAMQNQVRPEMYSGHVDVSMSVNRYGRISDIEVLTVWPEGNGRVAERLTRSLRGTRMRPRLENGEPVDAEEVVIRFPYWY